MPTTAASRHTPDPRVRRTRRALQDALVELLDDIEPVSVSAVAQRAGLSRQAMHAHYASVEHLAAEVLARRLLEATGHEAPVDLDAATTLLVDGVRRDGLEPFLRFIQDDRATFLALRRLSHGLSTAILAQVFAGLAGDLAPGPDRASPYGALFVAGGMTTLVDTWLGSTRPPAPHEQAALLGSFAHAVLAAGAGSAPTER